MKIVCEACQAKYSISDDKVRGKAFKIRCKKCSHIIVVRSTAASMPVAEGSSSAQPLPVQDGSGLSGLTAAPTSENTWHIVVEGEQVGPLSASDIRARLSRGEITGETFIWREGLADWQKISSVSDFADVSGGEDDAGTPFPSQPATTVYPPGTAESAFAASPAPNGEQDVFAAPTMVSSTPASADLFASPVSAPTPAASSSFSFGGGASASAESSPIRVHGNGAAGLTGQRHENSVLFSLSNLEALAAPSAAPVSSAPRPGLSSTGGSDGSGLIDIRSMAAMTLGNQNEPRVSSDLPTFGAPQFSPVAPVLLPLGPSSGPSKLIYVLIGVGLLFTIVVGTAAFMMLKKPSAPAASTAPTVATAPAPSAAPAAPTAPAPPPAAAVPTTPTTTPPPANEVLPPRETPKPAATAAGKGGKKGGKGAKGSKGTEVAAASPTPAPAAVAPVKAEPAAKRDRLDDLLDGALGTKPKTAARAPEDDAPRQKAAPAASSSLPSLEKSDIVKAMMGVQPKVKDCFNQYKVPGTAMMTIKVARGGKVSDASVGGKFAGTPTGSCLESAAKGAKFPPTEAQTIQYPFLLH